ncbi:MAG: Crp/Fnr family transcriptional regulator [Planctomycetes bacterium]|nr:Crp/Fnr family transcriptional regulator [Planctomycetota bacterium]MCB9909487.1 Crp/Fnr family transcriptional regulator [Planctomycetota bacterium]MCB9912546.1 Crp/Fnr family transcriptional regulator [Planctomycetota bacterium]HPF13876.1 Crp/Fnr family transcriptional regulator [Planctomycetota bacterium]
MVTKGAPSLVGILSETPIFAGLDTSQLEAIAAVSELRNVASGQRVFEAGKLAEHFFVLVDGRVRLEFPAAEGKGQVVGIFRKGDFIGVASALHMGVFPLHAVATPPGLRVLAVEARGFRKRLHTDPILAEAVIAGLCERMFGLIQRVEEMTGEASGRLARYLLSQPTESGHPIPTVRLAIKKGDLARRLDIAPATFSRILKRWRDLGLVQVRGRSIAILEPDRLEADAAGTHSLRT